MTLACENRRKIRLFSQAKVTQTEIITRTKKKLSDSRGLSQRAQLCKTRFKLDAMFKSHALQCPPTTSQVTQSNRRGKKGLYQLKVDVGMLNTREDLLS